MIELFLICPFPFCFVAKQNTAENSADVEGKVKFFN